MRKFISFFYNRIFIESLDLSYNYDLGDDFSTFVVKYFNNIILEKEHNFKLQYSGVLRKKIEFKRKSAVI